MDKHDSQPETVTKIDVHRLLAVGKILTSVLTANEIDALQAYLKDNSENPFNHHPIEFTEIQIGNTSVT